MPDHDEATFGSITLMGSGELSPGMSRTHRAVMADISPPLKAVFLDTPAGFQLNVHQISQKAGQYFKKHFNLNIVIASFRALDEASREDISSALLKLKAANYIFAGPGSPTYAVKNWKNTEILKALHSKLNNGAHLVFASAASIAMGSYALPVYEIYKVGERPHWIQGLAFFEPYGYQVAVIPHWNNKEGGTHDTRFCYMGEPRLKILEDLLPPSVAVLGIDEYTALKLDLKNREGVVLGGGSVIIRMGGQEISFESGRRFDLKCLKDIAEGSADRCEITYSENAPGRSFPHDVNWPEKKADDDHLPAEFIDLLVWVRTQMRNEQKWQIADDIRQKLFDFGIILEDGLDGTTWRKG